MDKRAVKQDRFLHLLYPVLILLVLQVIVFRLPAAALAALPGSTVSFSDLEGHWARSHITRLAALDAVKGNPDHTFKPDQQISRLETVVLLMRSGGFTAEAEQLARIRTSSTAGAKAAQNTTPVVPWGQQYLNLAVHKGFLQLDNPSEFDFDAPATRLEVARLLAHALYLLPPSTAGAGTGENENSSSIAGFALDKTFTDEYLVQPGDRTCLRALAAAGIMSGYPDGAFRPLNYLTRAEMTVILSQLVDRGWIKIADGRRLTGLISKINISKSARELELITPEGLQKCKVAQGVYCYGSGEEADFEQAVDWRAEVILNSSKQVLWVNLLQRKETAPAVEKIRGSVKSVALGRENLLVLSDSNCENRILFLDWDAVVYKKDALQSFAALKPGTFLDVEINCDKIKKANVLEVKTVSGQIEKLDSKRLFLKGGLSGSKPGWFNYYDRARVVDKEGDRRGDVQVGETVQITYLDPFPKEIDDEIPLEIKVTK
ncbi:MAG: S-layer homology domain-containing protein [Peptococcaceae bacterium]|nr:S-layer homology domain-containing protein [Peptococcaceae bacterium]